MPLGSPFINSIPLRGSDAGRKDLFLAAAINPCGVMYDPAGVQIPVLTSDPINLADDAVDAAVAAARAGYLIVVFSLYGLTSDVLGDMVLGSKVAADPTVAISGVFSNAARGGEVLGHNPHGWFKTKPGAALVANLDGGATSFQVNYGYLNASYFYNEDGTLKILETGEPELIG